MIESSYSRIDQLLHNLAFNRASSLQDVMVDLEDRFLSSTWKSLPAASPIFVTSLPRSGTTILLEMLSQLTNIATHTYRDMPFIQSPVIWSKVSSRFRTEGNLRERAHGDGLKINEDSPEAFEEVLWRKHYPLKYDGHNILLWHASDYDAAFSRYLRDHMRKIISLRGSNPNETRYASKNNANIARIGSIRAMFGDARILIPFRDPIEHAVSLWRQHLLFTKVHMENGFAKKYMADIGHFEFGSLHRPIAFNGIEGVISQWTPGSLEYWVGYWICAFSHLLTEESVVFVSYEELCKRRVSALEAICDVLNVVVEQSQLEVAAQSLHSAPASRGSAHYLPKWLERQAQDVYQTLRSRSLSLA